MTVESDRLGPTGFRSGLEELDISVENRGALVVYRLVPLSGSMATKEVETGVEVSELDGWPTAPPHWVHVPDDVRIPGGSTQPSSLAGWSRYSRPHPGRLDASRAPTREWVAHVRALLGTAA